ncbi:hypothetical protein INE90_01122 [Bacteroides uniformis]|uniref:hypothetical protein n=1 Tax=Bacteroidaceae TaxID=815 RepID=UPI001B8C4F29|nr:MULTISPECIES: hypothetical protein [Bacteroidaceae]MBT0708794.1 hypothetical protein [Phocaeicola vulgatus]QUT34377.1 hypothetical protein INE90_01122 [Bacteroides uniformis]
MEKNREKQAEAFNVLKDGLGRPDLVASKEVADRIRELVDDLNHWIDFAGEHGITVELTCTSSCTSIRMDALQAEIYTRYNL